MNKKLFIAVGCLALLSAANQASAVVLSLDPGFQTAGPADVVTVDLTISGLGNFSADSLGDFDIDIGYDMAALTLNSFTLGNFLGDFSQGEAIDFSLGDLGGIINTSVLSLLEADAASCISCEGPYLNDIQPDTFSLATFEFTVTTLSPGSSTIVSIANVFSLGDAFGVPLQLEDTTDATISNPAVSIPAPGTLALLGLGLLCIAAGRRTAA